MYEVKNTVFLYFTKRQKSALCTFLRSFVKLHKEYCAEDVLNKFIEDETYYYDIRNPHFYFAVENFENDEFIRDLKRYIEALFADLKYKDGQKSILKKQKEFVREQRKRASEFKMKKEEPTFKQLKYYKSLCKNHKLEPKNTEGASKFDLKKWIGEILDDKNPKTD